jgi:hypothetical protein
MIFSRFKNLNSTIREYIASQKNDDESKKAERSTKQTGEQSSKSEISEEKSEDIELLHTFIKWFNINIRQMTYFNQVFGLSMTNFFFVHSCGLMIALEDLIYKYEKQSLFLIICNIFFNVYRIAIFVYIVKQTEDITREASKTSRYVNEFCHLKYIEGNNEEFKKKVNKFFKLIF